MLLLLWPNFTFYFIADLIFCVSNNDDVFRKDGCVDNIETHSVKNKQARQLLLSVWSRGGHQQINPQRGSNHFLLTLGFDTFALAQLICVEIVNHGNTDARLIKVHFLLSFYILHDGKVKGN